MILIVSNSPIGHSVTISARHSQYVIATMAKKHVMARCARSSLSTDQHIVSGIAEQCIIPISSEQGVIIPIAIYPVVAALTIDGVLALFALKPIITLGSEDGVIACCSGRYHRTLHLLRYCNKFGF
jgi:hypothetical protein